MPFDAAYRAKSISTLASGLQLPVGLAYKAGKLYLPVGAPCNVCEREADRYANMLRMNPDGSAKELVATRPMCWCFPTVRSWCRTTMLGRSTAFSTGDRS